MPWCLELKGFTVVFVSFCPQPKVPTWILTESVPHAVLLLLWKTAWSSAGPLASATFMWGCVWSQTKPRVWTLMPASLSSRYVCVLFVLTCLPVLLLGGQAIWPAWKIKATALWRTLMEKRKAECQMKCFKDSQGIIDTNSTLNNLHGKPLHRIHRIGIAELELTAEKSKHLIAQQKWQRRKYSTKIHYLADFLHKCLQYGRNFHIYFDLSVICVLIVPIIFQIAELGLHLINGPHYLYYLSCYFYLSFARYTSGGKWWSDPRQIIKN